MISFVNTRIQKSMTYILGVTVTVDVSVEGFGVDVVVCSCQRCFPIVIAGWKQVTCRR